MSRLAIGLDIGGANLKLATSDGRARSRPFELWKHPDRLTAELRDFVSDSPTDAPVGVTMTGELCDCFETKRDGVRHILAAASDVFGRDRTRVWGTDGRFLDLEEAADEYLVVAAANWHALATFVGRWVPDRFAYLIDVGSTTTDVIPLFDGCPIPIGKTDTARFKALELVYSGIRRTPVGVFCPHQAAAELFATTQDVYVLLGQLPEAPHDTATADGRPVTIRHSHGRLARAMGGDGFETQETETKYLATTVARVQRHRIVLSLISQSGRHDKTADTFIISGAGEFVARAALEPFAGERISLSERLGSAVSEAACAYAVAVLMSETARAPS